MSDVSHWRITEGSLPQMIHTIRDKATTAVWLALCTETWGHYLVCGMLTAPRLHTFAGVLGMMKSIWDSMFLFYFSWAVAMFKFFHHSFIFLLFLIYSLYFFPPSIFLCHIVFLLSRFTFWYFLGIVIYSWCQIGVIMSAFNFHA